MSVCFTMWRRGKTPFRPYTLGTATLQVGNRVIPSFLLNISLLVLLLF